MATKSASYPARLDIDYSNNLNRMTTFFRIIWSIPILIVIGILTGSGDQTMVDETGKIISRDGSGITGALFAATALMLLFRQRYPRWWFDFALELNRFGARVGAYLLLLTDRYPSTVDSQSVHLDIDYPNVKRDLSSWMPLVKWFLAIPHYIVLAVLITGVLFVTIFAWFSILFTGSYPRSLFDYVVGVGRWSLRVNAYAFLLVTDQYPPFSLK